MNRQGVYINGKQVFDSKGKEINSIEIIGSTVQTVVGINKGSISMVSSNNALIVDGQTIAFEPSPTIHIEVFGNITNLNSGAGNVNIKGDVSHIETVSGDVNVDGTVTSDVRTVSGDIRCKTIAGEVETISGDIYR
ncbi:TPA: heme utilization protein [Mannheimia haemolytica]|nr:heme utilization protein [Mannheimia haemolytica]